MQDVQSPNVVATPSSREYRGTPNGLCVSRVVRLAKLPKFGLEQQTVLHTFQIQ